MTLSTRSDFLRLPPSSIAAMIVMALAGPIPLMVQRSFILSLASWFRSLLASWSMSLARSTALLLRVPLPSNMPSSSALLSVSRPLAASFSRGLSFSLQFL
jgi:hypothetical protein